MIHYRYPERYPRKEFSPLHDYYISGSRVRLYDFTAMRLRTGDRDQPQHRARMRMRNEIRHSKIPFPFLHVTCCLKCACSELIDITMALDSAAAHHSCRIILRCHCFVANNTIIFKAELVMYKCWHYQSCSIDDPDQL